MAKEELEELSEKERERRRKIKEAFQKRRMKGYRTYIRRKRAEKKKLEEKKRKEKEREKKRKEKEREKARKKKKPGRPKKTGPKPNYYKRRKKREAKLNKPKVDRSKPPYIYKIISCINGKQDKFIGKYRTIEDAYEVFNSLKENDAKVVFQVETTGCDRIFNSVNEYLLIGKSDAENSVLRNEYGKLVEQVLNKDGWVILDKHRYKKEETFWLFGHDNRSDRKTFDWLYENIVTAGMESKYEFNRILVFKNKVIVKYDSGKIEMVICKTEHDAIRFYNLAQTWAKRDKIKNLLFCGDYSKMSDRRRKLEAELLELTGWNLEKIRMGTTTYYLKN